MTWNIRHGLGIDGVQSIERILKLIEEVKPDIVGLNEVESRTPGSRFINQAAWLAERLGYDWFFSPTIGFRSVGYGNAILSRYPIIHRQRQRLSWRHRPRGLILAWADIGFTLTCILVHIDFAPVERRKQLSEVSSIVKAQPHPVILFGDLNSDDQIEAFREATEGLVDALSDSPNPTFPAWRPRRRLDHIFTSPDCGIISSEVVPTIASDHLAVAAVLEVNRGRDIEEQSQTEGSKRGQRPPA